MKLSATQQLLAADDVNLLSDSMSIINKSTDTPINASREVGVEINIERTKYMLVSRHQNAAHNRDIKILNRLFGNVSQLLPFSPETSVFVCCSKNLEITIFKTIILPVILYGCETWSLTVTEEHIKTEGV
jgi:hypothetical protein